MRKILSLSLFVAIFCFGLQAEAKKASFVGSWKLHSMTVNGKNASPPPSIHITYHFKKKGGFSVHMKHPKGNRTESGKWTEKNGILTIVSNGKTRKFKWSATSSSLTLKSTSKNVVMHLKK